MRRFHLFWIYHKQVHRNHNIPEHNDSINDRSEIWNYNIYSDMTNEYNFIDEYLITKMFLNKDLMK